MSVKIDGPLPARADLSGGWQIQFRACDPVTGADISGVKVSNVGLLVAPVGASGSSPTLQAGTFQLIPIDELNDETP